MSSNELDAKINSAIENINMFAKEVFEARNTEFYAEKYRLFLDCVKIEYYNYLLYGVYRVSSPEELDEKKLEKFEKSYCNTLKSIEQIFERYDSKEGLFFEYFISITKVLKTKKKNAINKINEGAEEVFNAKNTIEYQEKLNDFKETIKKEYYNYLLYSIGKVSTPEKLDSETLEIIDESYVAVFKNEKFIEGIIEKYNPEKGIFFNYFYRSANYIGKKAVNTQYFNNVRCGITKLFSKNDISLLSKILDFKKSTGDDLSNPERLEEFCNEYEVKSDMVLEVWKKNQEAYCMSIYVPSTENNEFNILDKYVSDENNILDSYIFNSSDSDQEPKDNFEAMLVKLNELYQNSFSENDKKIFPLCFTNNYILASVDCIKEKYKLPNRNEAIEKYWSDIKFDLENKREMYANCKYHCISQNLFNYVLESKRLLSQQDIAKNIGFTPAYISKEYKKILNVLIQKGCSGNEQ